MSNEVKIAWGRSKETNLPVHVFGVKKGLDCNLVCPNPTCAIDLEAVNSENPSAKRRPHLRHTILPANAGDCAEAVNILVAKEATRNLVGALTLPSFSVEATVIDIADKVHKGRASIDEQQVSLILDQIFDDEAIAEFHTPDGRTLYLLLKANAQIPTNAKPQSAVLALDLKGTAISMEGLQQAGHTLQRVIQHGRWLCHWQEEALKIQAVDGAERRASEASRKKEAKEQLAARRLAARPRIDVTSYWYGCRDCKIKFGAIQFSGGIYCPHCRRAAEHLHESARGMDLIGIHPWEPPSRGFKPAQTLSGF